MNYKGTSHGYGIYPESAYRISYPEKQKGTQNVLKTVPSPSECIGMQSSFKINTD